MSEDRETRLKRLRLRSWRRGTREMDLILGPFADAELVRFAEAELDAFEQLLEAPDWDLYAWVTRAEAAPREHEPLIRRLASFHKIP